MKLILVFSKNVSQSLTEYSSDKTTRGATRVMNIESYKGMSKSIPTFDLGFYITTLSCHPNSRLLLLSLLCQNASSSIWPLNYSLPQGHLGGSIGKYLTWAQDMILWL